MRRTASRVKKAKNSLKKVQKTNLKQYLLKFVSVFSAVALIAGIFVYLPTNVLATDGAEATISATKIVCDSESDLPDWVGAGHPSEITATTAADFLATHPNCHQAAWTFLWVNLAQPSVLVNFDSTTTLPAVASVPADSAFFIGEVQQAGYIPFADTNVAPAVSAEFYCSNDFAFYDNGSVSPVLAAGVTYHCVAFNVPVEVVVPPPTPTPVPTPTPTPTATISATKIVCNNESDLPDWVAAGHPTEITGTTGADFLATHENCHQAAWTFLWVETTTPGLPITNFDSTASVAATATVPANVGIFIGEVQQAGYIPFADTNVAPAVSAEFYCSNDFAFYDNGSVLNLTTDATAHCLAFNVPVEVVTPPPTPTPSPTPTPTPTPVNYTLTVETTGEGQGTVTSEDGFINCNSDSEEQVACTHDYLEGSAVTLTATASEGSSFTDTWFGACTGNNPICNLVMNSNLLATAHFSVQPPATAPVTPPSNGASGPPPLAPNQGPTPTPAPTPTPTPVVNGGTGANGEVLGATTELPRTGTGIDWYLIAFGIVILIGLGAHAKLEVESK